MNLAWLDDDAPLNAPRLLRPTQRLADAALEALEAPRPSLSVDDRDDAADDRRETAKADADLRCAAAGLLGFAATDDTIEANGGEEGGWRDAACASRAVGALASNIDDARGGSDGFGGFGQTGWGGRRGGREDVRGVRSRAARDGVQRG